MGSKRRRGGLGGGKIRVGCREVKIRDGRMLRLGGCCG